jgi:hypothetical protein
MDLFLRSIYFNSGFIYSTGSCQSQKEEKESSEIEINDNNNYPELFIKYADTIYYFQ